MTYDEFQQQIGKAGLKLNEFADLVKMHPASIYNFAKNGVPSHVAIIVLLLGEMGERGIDYREVLSRTEITPKKARGAGIGKLGGTKD
jgi:hypothetical protein